MNTEFEGTRQLEEGEEADAHFPDVYISQFYTNNRHEQKSMNNQNEGCQ